MRQPSKILYKLLILLLLFATSDCMNNEKKTASNQPGSIYKTWHFKKMDATSSHKTTWIGNNILDMRNKDTLQFSYDGMHNKPTAYPYKIQHDTIFIENKPGYKIVKLTDSELYVMAIFNHPKNAAKDSNVMIYGIK